LEIAVTNCPYSFGLGWQLRYLAGWRLQAAQRGVKPVGVMRICMPRADAARTSASYGAQAAPEYVLGFERSPLGRLADVGLGATLSQNTSVWTVVTPRP
jgi:hypothetical protein